MGGCFGDSDIDRELERAADFMLDIDSEAFKDDPRCTPATGEYKHSEKISCRCVIIRGEKKTGSE